MIPMRRIVAEYNLRTPYHFPVNTLKHLAVQNYTGRSSVFFASYSLSVRIYYFQKYIRAKPK